MRASALALALALAACSTEPAEPDTSTTIAGDGDGDMGDGDGDGAELVDMGEPALDLPAGDIWGCCWCGQDGWCEAETYPTQDACLGAGQEAQWPVEWHEDCYYSAENGLVCPGSCVHG